jgi:hypothetical protein
VTSEDFTQDDGDGVYTHGFSETSDEYYILVNNTEGDEQSVDSITLDKASPSVEEVSPSTYTQDSPTVEVDASDSLSGIDRVFLNVTDEDGNEVENTVGQELDLSNLDDGRYEVEYTAYDRAGNTRNDDWTFYVDTSYDGSTDLDVQQSPGEYRVSGDNFVIPLMLNGTETDESEVRIRCEMGDYSLESGWRDPESSQYFECAPDTSQYADMTLDLSVVVEDRAGNSYTENVGEYVFDRTSPTLENLETYAEVQNGDFEVNYEASDRASGVEKIHYQVGDSDLDLSAGSNRSSDGDSFTVDTSNLESGSHTVYAWAVDGVGRASTMQSLDFSYDPSATPEVRATADDYEVTAGERGTISVNVSNTGEIFVDAVNLELSSNVFNASREISDLTPGSETTEAFTFDTVDEDLGVRELAIDVNPGEGDSIELRVSANQDQRSDLEERLEEWIGKQEALQENVTELNSKVNDERSSRLEENFSDFNSTLQTAIEARESGDYWRVSDVLDGIDENYSQAKESFEEVREEFETSQSHRRIAFALLMLVSLGGFGIGYAFYSESIEMELEALESAMGNLSVPQTGISGAFAGVYESFLEVLEEEEEEVESGFQGFT